MFYRGFGPPRCLFCSARASAWIGDRRRDADALTNLAWQALQDFPGLLVSMPSGLKTGSAASAGRRQPTWFLQQRRGPTWLTPCRRICPTLSRSSPQAPARGRPPPPRGVASFGVCSMGARRWWPPPMVGAGSCWRRRPAACRRRDWRRFAGRLCAGRGALRAAAEGGALLAAAPWSMPQAGLRAARSWRGRSDRPQADDCPAVGRTCWPVA